MKAIVVWVAVLGIQGALAEEQSEGQPEQPKWQTPQEVLAAVDAGKAPKKPQVWQSPRGPVVLHGDLFGDGRHLALVGTTGASWAVAKNGKWEVAGQLDVWPVWVPPGTAIDDERYSEEHRCNAPEVPFVLKDLDGDRVPEVLITFNNDSHNTGYSIARKDGKGIKVMDLRSERGVPEWTGKFLVVTTSVSGRKCWGSDDTYFRWQQGVAVPVATWGEDTKDLDKFQILGVRHQAGGKDRDFELVQNEDGPWNVRSRDWKGAGETATWKDFAKIEVTEIRKSSEIPNSWKVEEALLFELITGISGAEMRSPLHDFERFDFAKESARFQVKIEGSDEAKKTLKRVSK